MHLYLSALGKFQKTWKKIERFLNTVIMKYIDAERLSAEIERRLDELNPKTGMFGDRPLRAVNPKTFPRESELEKVLYLIESLQQDKPDVDLEKEIRSVWEKCNPVDEGMGVESVYMHIEAFDIIVRHFYELGNIARKEEAK